MMEVKRYRIDTSKMDPPWAESTAGLFMGAEVELVFEDHKFGMSRVRLTGPPIVARHMTWATGDAFFVADACLVEVDA